MNTEMLLREYLGIHNEKLLDALSGQVSVYTLKKGQLDISAGDQVEAVHFLLQGVARSFYQDEHGREMTDCLIYDGGSDLIMCDSLTSGVSNIFIQALTPCEIASVSLSTIYALMPRYPEIFQIVISLYERSLSVHREHKRVIAQYSAKERYDWMKQNFPDLMKRIKKKYVAAYLQITPQTLSSLRRLNQEDD